MVTGSLQIQGGIYHCVLNIYENGKRKQKSVTTKLPVKGNKRRAEEFLENLKKEYGQKEDIKKAKSSDMLVSDFIKQWLQITKPTIERSTFESYENMFNARVDGHFRKLNVTLDTLEPSHIRTLYEQILSEGFTTNTVIHYHALIRKALQYAVKNGIISNNTADRVDRPKKNKFVGSFYSQNELLELFDATVHDPLYLVIYLTAHYGFRRSEVLGIRWSAIDFEAKTITVSHKVTEAKVNGKFVLYAEDKLKNSSSHRTLPLITNVEAMLLQSKERQERNQKLLKKAYCKDYLDYVCVDDTGRLFRPNYVTEHFGRILNKYELRKIRFHDMRHSCASLLLAAGIAMKAIQEWLGHSTFATTADTYSHLDFSSKKESAAKLGEILSGQNQLATVAK